MPISTSPELCCSPVLQARLGKAQAEELATAFRAVADPARLQLLSFIAAQPGEEACVCNLMKPLGLSQPTVSHHLKVLFEAGLLGRERRGSWVYYRILPERMAALRDALAPPGAKSATRRARARA
jgi:ArsR family transcriptional regulator, arsenate/arsenite/antimonite-responsive transcriptional repressor